LGSIKERRFREMGNVSETGNRKASGRTGKTSPRRVWLISEWA
jgi:hypothetical protein